MDLLSMQCCVSLSRYDMISNTVWPQITDDSISLSNIYTVYLTLQLPGVENCQNYTFRYGRHPLMELPLMINPTGCARSEPKILTHCKRQGYNMSNY